jgi:hypothetical protein
MYNLLTSSVKAGLLLTEGDSNKSDLYHRKYLIFLSSISGVICIFDINNLIISSYDLYA